MEVPDVLIDFCDRMERATIPYVIGGSVAAGAWGEPRQTNDVDVEVWVGRHNVYDFLSMLDRDYEVDEAEALRAVDSVEPFRSVQALHLGELLKIDCFLKNHTSWETEALDRAVEIEIREGKRLRLASAEHILVQKLRWYELSNRTSERQWRDLLAIARITDVDWDLVDHWAKRVGVSDAARELKAASSHT